MYIILMRKTLLRRLRYADLAAPRSKYNSGGLEVHCLFSSKVGTPFVKIERSLYQTIYHTNVERVIFYTGD